MKLLVCSICKQKYKADVEGPDDEEHPICVGCITTLFDGSALSPQFKIQPVTLQEFRKRMKAMNSGKIKGRLRIK